MPVKRLGRSVGYGRKTPAPAARLAAIPHCHCPRLGHQVRLHDLCHTAASLLLARAVHPKLVQEMLGHSAITLTLDTYGHVTPGLHRGSSRGDGST